MDIHGLKGCCGKADVTTALENVLKRIENDFNGLNETMQEGHCNALYAKDTRESAWDIKELAANGLYDAWKWPHLEQGSGLSECERTVTVAGKCYYSAAVNYAMWGKINSLCNKRYQGQNIEHTFMHTIAAVGFWKTTNYLLNDPSSLQINHLTQALDFTRYGYYGKLTGMSHLKNCSTKNAEPISNLNNSWKDSQGER